MFPVKLPDATSREQKVQQIKNWAGSETERSSSEYHPAKKIKFPLGVILIAACYAGDREEFKRVLEMGIDINTKNPDGMTCVHQCCINGDYEFLEFLIKEGADINVQDNEGWTPLHAAASVGCVELVRLLLDHAADLSLLSCDMELPVDVSQDPKVTELLTQAMLAKGIESSEARLSEARALARDAEHWLSIGHYEPVVDPRTGATPLHVAACKDYVDVLKMLLKVPGIDVNCQDVDGWTPLHAAAHWNREHPARFLAEAGASFDIYSYTNQSIFDVADRDIIVLLRQLRDKYRSQKSVLASVPPSITKLGPIPAPPDGKASDTESVSSTESSEDLSDAELIVQPSVAAGDGNEPISNSNRTSPERLVEFPGPDKMNEVAHKTSVTFEGLSKPDMSGTLEPSMGTPPDSASAEAPPSTISPSEEVIDDVFPDGKDLGITSQSSVDNMKKANLIDSVLKCLTSKESVSSSSKQMPLVNGPSPLLNGPSVTESSKTPPIAESVFEKADIACEITKPSLERAERISSMRLRKLSKEHSPPPQATTFNSARIVTIRKKPVPPPSTASEPAVFDSRSIASSKTSDNSFYNRRTSLLMSPAKSGETETQRSVKARHVRSTRRSTQGVTADDMAEAKKLVGKNNSAVVVSRPQLTIVGDTLDSIPSTVRIMRSTDAENDRPLGSNINGVGHLNDRSPPLLPVNPSDGCSSSLSTVPVGKAVDSLVTVRSNRYDAEVKKDDPQSKGSSASSFSDRTPSEFGPSSTPCSTRSVMDSRRGQNTAQLSRGARSWSSRVSGSSEIDEPKQSVQSTLESKAFDIATSNCTTSSQGPPPSVFPKTTHDAAPPYVLKPTSRLRLIHSDLTTSVNSSNDLPSSLSSRPNYVSSGQSTSDADTPYDSNQSLSDRFIRDRQLASQESIDYRRLYEKEKVEKERLVRQLDRFTRENANLRAQLARIQREGMHTLNPVPNNTTSGVEDLHNRLLHREDQLKELNRLREENSKMREENGALIRVISKLSRPA